MNTRLYILLFLLGIFVLLPVVIIQKFPGYMDADYYFAGGLRLAEGHGFSELIIWNYLDDPKGLPHPSHGYWMPLASIIAAVSMELTNAFSFSAAISGFVLIAGLIPPITSALAYSFTFNKNQAMFSGILAAFPVFYLAYLGTTDTFAIYMLLGALWFIILGRVNNYEQKERRSYYIFLFFGLGIISGLMHLARADGVLWLLLGLLSIIMIEYTHGKSIGFFRRIFLSQLVLILGYLLVMGPWMIRNLSEFGIPLAPGGIKTLWLTEYDDLYAYPADTLTFERWWSVGLDNIFRSRITAFSQNLQTVLFVQGLIVFAPLIFVGMWRLRNDHRIKIGFIAWFTTFFIMTFVFTEVGWRGGFFHSGAALQPLFWAIIPVGLEAFVHRGVRTRNWNPKQATQIFRGGVVILVFVLTVFLAWRRVVGANIYNPAWNQSARRYLNIESKLKMVGASDMDLVLVNNAPGYYVTNFRPSISIPNGDINNSLEVARHYGGRYLLLETNHPSDLDGTYQNPTDLPGLEFLDTIENTHIYLINIE